MAASTIGYSPLASSSKTALQKGTIPAQTEFEPHTDAPGDTYTITIDEEKKQKVR